MVRWLGLTPCWVWWVNNIYLSSLFLKDSGKCRKPTCPKGSDAHGNIRHGCKVIVKLLMNSSYFRAVFFSHFGMWAQKSIQAKPEGWSTCIVSVIKTSSNRNEIIPVQHSPRTGSAMLCDRLLLPPTQETIRQETRAWKTGFCSSKAEPAWCLTQDDANTGSEENGYEASESPSLLALSVLV